MWKVNVTNGSETKRKPVVDSPIRSTLADFNFENEGEFCTPKKRPRQIIETESNVLKSFEDVSVFLKTPVTSISPAVSCPVSTISYMDASVEVNTDIPLDSSKSVKKLPFRISLDNSVMDIKNTDLICYFDTVIVDLLNLSCSTIECEEVPKKLVIWYNLFLMKLLFVKGVEGVKLDEKMSFKNIFIKFIICVIKNNLDNFFFLYFRLY